MKYIVYIFISIFVFIGCAPKTELQRGSSVQYDDVQKQIAQFDTKEVKDSTSVYVPEKAVIVDTIAVVYPSVNIGKYALDATNSINTFLLYKGTSFHVMTFDMFIQNKKNILNTFEKLKEKNITKAIVMITKENLSILNSIDGIDDIEIYLPLVNKNEITNFNQIKNLKVTFGAISYEEQFKYLFDYAQRFSLVELYDNTAMGDFLHNYLKTKKVSYSKKVDDNNGRYQYFLKGNRYINNSAIVLNTPIVKSSILLSSITAQELNPATVLSTQLNYTPLIFSLTQKIDRKGLIVANSIGDIPLDLIEYNEILGNSISYNWVNYSSIVGAELLTSKNISFFKDLKLENNQVVYPVKLYEVKEDSFKLIK